MCVCIYVHTYVPHQKTTPQVLRRHILEDISPQSALPILDVFDRIYPLHELYANATRQRKQPALNNAPALDSRVWLGRVVQGCHEVLEGFGFGL